MLDRYSRQFVYTVVRVIFFALLCCLGAVRMSHVKLHRVTLQIRVVKFGTCHSVWFQ
jgi:hypothetical protein